LEQKNVHLQNACAVCHFFCSIRNGHLVDRLQPEPFDDRCGAWLSSGVPERTYAPRDAENAAPVAPKRTERVDDFADFSFGKIEL